MTQDDYQLWTNQTASFTDEDWTRIVNNASKRLASFLCLDELPTDDDGKIPDDLQEVLANFICGVLRLRGSSQEVSSKHIRNFTINFRSSEADNAFANIAAKYSDVIDEYSKCGLGFTVEKSKRCCCGCL